jgi:hypothetical protein
LLCTPLAMTFPCKLSQWFELNHSVVAVASHVDNSKFGGSFHCVSSSFTCPRMVPCWQKIWESRFSNHWTHCMMQLAFLQHIDCNHCSEQQWQLNIVATVGIEQ